jgi:hypothetical protein
MCEGIKVIEQITTELGSGYVSEFMLAETCEDHGSQGVAVGGVFSPSGQLVRAFEPIPVSTDDEGRVNFVSTVSLLNEEMAMMVSVTTDINSL